MTKNVMSDNNCCHFMGYAKLMPRAGMGFLRLWGFGMWCALYIDSSLISRKAKRSRFVCERL